MCVVKLDTKARIEKINEDGNDKLVKEERALKTGFKKQFKGKCRVCGKIGHKGTDCWTLDSNKEKRPTGYNDKNDGNKNLRADLPRKYDRLVDWGRIEKNNDDRNDKVVKEEKVLKTGFKKQFKGKCRVCGKIGHKGTDCWTLDSNKDKQPIGYNDKNDTNRNYKFNSNCNYCDKKGHKEANNTQYKKKTSKNG